MGRGMTAAVMLPHGRLRVLVLVPSFSKVRVAKDIAIQMCDVLDGGEYVGVLNAPNMAAARKAKLTPYVSLGERMGALQAQLLGQSKVRKKCIFLKEQDYCEERESKNVFDRRRRS